MFYYKRDHSPEVNDSQMSSGERASFENSIGQIPEGLLKDVMNTGGMQGLGAPQSMNGGKPLELERVG